MYMSGKDTTEALLTFAVDIRTTSMEAWPSRDPEQHVQMNASRLTTFMLVADEIARCCEAHGVVQENRGNFDTHRTDDFMNVSKRKSKSKGRGKEPRDVDSNFQRSCTEMTLVLHVSLKP